VTAAWLLINLIFAVICAVIASNKGRSAVGWFFAGLFITWIGIIILACLSNLNEEDAERRRASQERRRLQEQLRQEKMKNESFRRHTYGRLDAHDRVLGVSTRETPELLGGPGGAPPASLPAEGGLARHGGVSAYEAAPVAPPEQWYFESGGTTQGPVTLGDLLAEIAAGAVRSGTLVWTEALGDWTPAARVTALQRVLRP
jgi:hypothetical protein